MIIRFSCRKKRNEILRKKGELKRKNIKIFVNEDLTPLRAALLRLVRDYQGVKNAVARNGSIVAWLTEDPNRAIEVDTPDDLHKVGIATADSKKLKMDHIVWDSNA